MDWYRSSEPRAELIVALNKSFATARVSVKVLEHTVCGNAVWSVAEVTARQPGVQKDMTPGQSRRLLRCHLFKRMGKQWGYRPISESEEPPCLSCPLTYLDMTTEMSPQWRAKVRDYHAQRGKPCQ